MSKTGSEHVRCPRCGYDLEFPWNFELHDAYIGCRVVEVAIRVLCDGCGALLEKLGAPSTVDA